MDLNKDTVPKAVQPLVDIQELLPLISLSMVVCLNSQDLNQPDRWLTNSLQASSLVNKAVMVLLQLSLQVNIQTHKWDTVALQALVATVVVPSKHRMLNGVPQQLKASETVSAAIKDNDTSLVGASNPTY
jgi:hypothetical protein